MENPDLHYIDPTSMSKIQAAASHGDVLPQADARPFTPPTVEAGLAEIAVKSDLEPTGSPEIGDEPAAATYVIMSADLDPEDTSDPWKQAGITIRPPIVRRRFWEDF